MATKGKELTPREIAEKLDVNPRVVRKFLRAHRGTVGKGKRHTIPANQLPKLRKDFAAWQEGSK